MVVGGCDIIVSFICCSLGWPLLLLPHCCCCYFLLVFFYLVLPHSSANYNGGCCLRFFFLSYYLCVCVYLCVCFTQCCIWIFTLTMDFGLSLELSCCLAVCEEIAWRLRRAAPQYIIKFDRLGNMKVGRGVKQVPCLHLKIEMERIYWIFSLFYINGTDLG